MYCYNEHPIYAAITTRIVVAKETRFNALAGAADPVNGIMALPLPNVPLLDVPFPVPPDPPLPEPEPEPPPDPLPEPDPEPDPEPEPEPLPLPPPLPPLGGTGDDERGRGTVVILVMGDLHTIRFTKLLFKPDMKTYVMTGDTLTEDDDTDGTGTDGGVGTIGCGVDGGVGMTIAGGVGIGEGVTGGVGTGIDPPPMSGTTGGVGMLPSRGIETDPPPSTPKAGNPTQTKRTVLADAVEIQGAVLSQHSVGAWSQNSWSGLPQLVEARGKLRKSPPP